MIDPDKHLKEIMSAFAYDHQELSAIRVEFLLQELADFIADGGRFPKVTVSNKGQLVV